MIATLAFLFALIPLHGTVLSTLPSGEIVVRNDAIAQTLVASTHRYRLAPMIHTRAGVGIDGYLDRSTTPWTLRDPLVAAPFTPGVPDPGRVIPVDAGTGIPNTELVDQDERIVHLDRDFRGKTVLLSFIFTRCPDKNLCPAISGKYAFMQSHLDPNKFTLLLVTLDPQYDSPAVLRDYAKQFGANPAIWRFLTGKGSSIQHMLNQFGINSLRESSANFIHNDRLFVITPAGKVAYVVETGAWDPNGVVAEAQSVAGMANNPFERLKLSLIASAVALCGGSQFAGIVLLEVGLFFIILAIVASSLWLVARVLWHDPAKRAP